jgi:hypothetical protein
VVVGNAEVNNWLAYAKTGAQQLLVGTAGPSQTSVTALGLVAANIAKLARAVVRQDVDGAAVGWNDHCESLLLHTRAQAETNAELMIPDANLGTGLYSLLQRSLPQTLPAAQHESLLGDMGRIYLQHAASGTRPAFDLFATGLALLRSGKPRKGRHPDWHAVGRGYPASKEGIADLLAKVQEPALNQFLQAVSAARAVPIPPVPVAAEKLARAEIGVGPRSRGKGDVPLAGADPLAARPQAEEPDEEFEEEIGPHRGSLVLWAVQRSNQAGYRRRWGVAGHWDNQTPGELKVVCKAIRQELESRGAHRAKALFALICLCTSLPMAKALWLATEDNGDIWVNSFRSWSWSMLRILNGELAAISCLPTPAELAVETALPQCAAAVGEEFLLLHPQAKTLVESLIGTGEESAARKFLEEARAWLRLQGAGWAHAVYDARFSASLWQIYRQCFGDIVTGLKTLNFDECSTASFNYLSVSQALLESAPHLVYDLLELGPPSPSAGATKRLGPARIPVDADLVLAWQELQRRIATARDDVAAASSAAELVSSHHELVHHRLLEVLFLAGGRGHHLERMTWRALYGHLLFVILRDKDTDEHSEARAVPVHALLRCALDSHVEDIRCVASRAAELGICVQDARGRVFGDPHPNRCVFTRIKVVQTAGGGLHLVRQGIDRARLVALAREVFGGELNVGRSVLISAAIEHGLDPWLLKVLTGHHKGHAEPFADTGAVSQQRALRLLRAGLDWILRPLRSAATPAASQVFTIGLPTLSRSLPPLRSVLKVGELVVRRALPPPWSQHAPTSLRLVAHLRRALCSADGPADHAAELLLMMLLVNWIMLSDIELIWAQSGSLTRSSACAAIAVWTRRSGREVHRTLEGPTILALRSAIAAGSRPAADWSITSARAAAWVRLAAPFVPWPREDKNLLDAIDQMVFDSMRLFVPPYLMAANEPAVGAATATRMSISRLGAQPTPEVDAQDALIFPPPRVGHGRRMEKQESPFQRLLERLHWFGNPQNRIGQDFARWAGLAGEAENFDCDGDARALCLVCYIKYHSRDWSEGARGALEVGSAGTYWYLLAPVIDGLRRDAETRQFHEEWFDLADNAYAHARAGDSVRREQRLHAMGTALRSLFRALAADGWPIPFDLLRSEKDAAPQVCSAHSAASTLILGADEMRVVRLVGEHFSEIPLIDRLAILYSSSRFELSVRTIEDAVLRTNALSPFGFVSTTCEGHSAQKSLNAWRIQPVSESYARKFAETAHLVSGVDPSERWLWLRQDGNDWSIAHAFESAFSAAVKQVSGEACARPYAARPVASRLHLWRNWESALRALLNGSAGVAECLQMIEELQRSGFSILVEVILRTGHGHALTYLQYYLVIWDLLLSLFCRAALVDAEEPTKLLRRHMPHAYSAFMKARSRAADAGASFDPWLWISNKALGDMALPPLVADPSPVGAAPVRREVNVAAESPTAQEARALYLALRLVGRLPVAAASDAGLTNAAAAALEPLVGRDASAELTRRRRRQDGEEAGEGEQPEKGRGQAAEEALLVSADGAELIGRLINAPPDSVSGLAALLSQDRRARLVPLPVAALVPRVVDAAKRIPDSFALLVQFGRGRAAPDEMALVANCHPRVHVGPSDRDIGAVPRVSVVSAVAPGNRVIRARLTSVVRCAVAAVGLLHDEAENAKRKDVQ